MPPDVPELGEVWLVRYPMPSNPGGKGGGAKLRPCVIVSRVPSADLHDTVIAVALSTNLSYRTRFSITVERRTRLCSAMGMTEEGAIFCEVVNTIGIDLLVSKIGKVNTTTLAKIRERLTKLLIDGED